MVVNVAPEASQQANEELNFQSKMERVNKELRELTDKETSNDKVENIDKYLNSAFMDELLKNENEETFNTLKKTVNSLMNNPETARAGGEGLTRLDKFLSDIDNQDRMKGDYEEFKEKIKVPSKLNTMKSWEIRRLNLYLGSMEHKEDALEVYKEMKKIEGDFDGKKMKSEDEEFFGNVWKTLKNSYSTDPDFIDQDYPGVKVLENAPTADNLKRVVKDSEKWSGENETIEGVQSTVSEGNSIVDKNYVIDMVKKANTERITNNKNAVNAINIGVNNSDFKLDGDNLKYNGEDFTSDIMMKYFGDSIKVSAGKSGSFINDAERDNTVNKCKDSIFQKLRSKLEDSLKDNGEEQIPENGKEAGNEWVMSDKDFNAMQQSLGDKMFIEKGESGAVTYNTDKAKDYLSSLKDLEWNQLKLKYPTGEGRAWMSAVQILLNEDRENKIKVDGKFGSETRNRIISYQNEYNKDVHEGGVRLNPDGLPGKNTIRALIGEEPEAEVTKAKSETPNPINTEKALDKQEDLFGKAIDNFELTKVNLSEDEKKQNGLEDKGQIYKNKNSEGGYFYYFEGDKMVRVPDFKSSNVSAFYTQETDLNTYRSGNFYPPVCENGIERFRTVYKSFGLNNESKIIGKNNQYCIQSHNEIVPIALPTFEGGWLFDKNNFGKDLIMLDFSNYLKNRFNKLKEKYNLGEKRHNIKFIFENGTIALRDKYAVLVRIDYVRRDVADRDTPEVKTIIEPYERAIGKLTRKQGEKFCDYLNGICGISS